ncbi:helix-turn-helix domain-containing protein [Streptomyces sp. DT24]|uniref:helix-turn-helix domain-containing protein n=1 Tax=Streptomyces sp. DT24 TaxID=3416520 RepID=UPI003CEDD7CE
MRERYEERASRFDGATVWTLDAPAGRPRPVLPDGCMDLLWSGDRLLVAGPDTHAFEASDVGGGRFTGIRFAPGTAPVLLGVPAHELRDSRVDLADLWPGAATRRLVARIGDAPDPAVALEELALRRAADTGPPDPLMTAVAARLGRGRSVAATAGSVGLGVRQLHRRSRAAFGYGPKTLARVLRLQRALALVRSATPYAEAALAAGCADQAHLAREMRDLTGMTLGAYLAGTRTGYEASANSETAHPSGSSTIA